MFSISHTVDCETKIGVSSCHNLITSCDFQSCKLSSQPCCFHIMSSNPKPPTTRTKTKKLIPGFDTVQLDYICNLNQLLKAF